jgi:hypothetical protein
VIFFVISLTTESPSLGERTTLAVVQLLPGVRTERERNTTFTARRQQKGMTEDEICVTIIEGKGLAVKDSCGTCFYYYY